MLCKKIVNFYYQLCSILKLQKSVMTEIKINSRTGISNDNIFVFAVELKINFKNYCNTLSFQGFYL